MSYTKRVDFVNDYGRMKTNIMEKMKSLEEQGLDDTQIQVKLLEDKLVRGVRSLYDFTLLYKNVKNQVQWI
jgi:hypothetical protein